MFLNKTNFMSGKTYRYTEEACESLQRNNECESPKTVIGHKSNKIDECDLRRPINMCVADL